MTIKARREIKSRLIRKHAYHLESALRSLVDALDNTPPTVTERGWMTTAADQLGAHRAAVLVVAQLDAEIDAQWKASPKPRRMK